MASWRIGHRLRRATSQAFCVAMALTACGLHYTTPQFIARDARFGYLHGAPDHLSPAVVCGHWRATVGRVDPHANLHVSYPETAPERSCFTPVTYTANEIRFGIIPVGCGYPQPSQVDRMRAVRDRLTHTDTDLGDLFPCGITAPNCLAAREHNARVLARAAMQAGSSTPTVYPYAAVVTFGFGWPDQVLTSIANWRPGDACHALSQTDIDRLGVMSLRTRRVADALRANLAPFALVSGGTEHSTLVEAFAMLFLLRCELGISSDRVLVEPCAEHTHTNLRNSGRWLAQLGARAAYIVTDDGVQKDYLEDFSGFELVFGAIDDRSLRDWGYLLGSWRRAAIGPNVGFWYTPYRFWAEPRAGLGSLTCVTGQDHASE